MIQQANLSFINLLFFILGALVVLTFSVYRPLLKTAVSHIAFPLVASETSFVSPIPDDLVVGK